MKQYIADKLRETNYNIKTVCNLFYDKYKIKIHRSIPIRIKNKMKNDMDIIEKRGRKSFMRDKVQELTLLHLEHLRKNSCPINTDIALYVNSFIIFFKL